MSAQQCGNIGKAPGLKFLIGCEHQIHTAADHGALGHQGRQSTIVAVKLLQEPFYPVALDCQFLTTDADAKAVLTLIIVKIDQGQAFTPEPLTMAIHLLVLPWLGK